MLFFPKSRAFGLEIGTAEIRAVQLERGYFGTRVSCAGELPLPKNPWLKNGLRDKAELSKQIETLLKSTKPQPITNTKVAVALPETSIFSKAIELPRVSARELRQTIPFEAGELLPLPIEEMYLDWQIDTSSIHKDKKAKSLHVFIVAAPRHLVDELTEAINQAGLSLASLESQSFALARSLEHLLDPKKVNLILNIDHRVTTLVFTTRQAIKLTATVSTGSLQLRDQQSKYLMTIADEISEGMKYYQNRLGEKAPVDAVLLTGPGATLPGLADNLTKSTKLVVKTGYASTLLPNGQPIHPQFNTVFGLAMRDL